MPRYLLIARKVRIRIRGCMVDAGCYPCGSHTKKMERSKLRQSNTLAYTLYRVVINNRKISLVVAAQSSLWC